MLWPVGCIGPVEEGTTHMAHELVIRGGTIVDGTGADRFAGDVAVDDGRISAVGGRLEGDRTIDADGAIVAPGWVDVHTHYDGQATWDDQLDPSFSNGVTTLVMGNCGVGFAPCPPGEQATLIELMEGVEDIPGTRARRRGAVGRVGELPRVPRLPRLPPATRSTSPRSSPTARCASR